MPNNAPHNALRNAVNRAIAKGSPIVTEQPVPPQAGTYLEYDWTFDVYRPRFGRTFIDWRGYRSFATKQEAEYILGLSGCKLGRKTDSRTWEILSSNPGESV